MGSEIPKIVSRAPWPLTDKEPTWNSKPFAAGRACEEMAAEMHAAIYEARVPKYMHGDAA